MGLLTELLITIHQHKRGNVTKVTQGGQKINPIVFNFVV